MNASNEIKKQPLITVLHNPTNGVTQAINTLPRALNGIQNFENFFDKVWQMKDLCQLIMRDLDFQDAVALRAVSKVMCGVMQFCIQCKVTISCWLSQFLISDALMEGKMSFRKEGNIGLILRVDSIDTVEIFNGSQSVLIEMDMSWNSIRGIDLSNIVINESNIKVIGEFFSNLDNLGVSDFLWLLIGDVFTDIKLSDKFKNLEKLYIGAINHSIEIQLSESLSELKSLTIACIGYDASIRFPACLEKLETCDIGVLYTAFQLPELPKLQKLSVEGLLIHDDFKGMAQIQYYGRLHLPKSLPELEELSINRIGDHLPFQLTSELNELTKLVFGTIGRGVKIKLSTVLDKLTKLYVKNFRRDTIFEFPASLASLRKVSIGSIQKGATINFPTLLNNFETLIIEELEEAVSINFRDLLLSQFKMLNIGCISNRGMFQLPDALANIEELVIGHLDCWSMLSLPALLSKLTDLTINKIDFNAKCDLSLISLPNLQNLVLKDNESSAIILLPKELNKLSRLYITNIKDTIQLPNALNCLRNFNIGSLNSPQFEFPNAMSLQSLKIDILETEFILPELENLASLIIENVYRSGYIQLQSLPMLETLIIGENKASPINLALPLPSLVHLSIGSLRYKLLSDGLILPILSNVFNSFSFDCVENDQLCAMICSLPNLTNLSIGKIEKALALLLPATIGELSSFSINYMMHGSTLELPHSLITLKELSIGKICEEATLKLPDSLEAIESLKFECVDNKGIIQYNPSLEAINYDHFVSKFLCSVSNLKNLDIGVVSENISLVLPSSLASLQKLNIAQINNNVIFNITSSKEIQNLTILTLGTIEKGAQVAIIGEYDNLEILIFGRVRSNLILTESLNKVKKIVISSIECDEFEFPATLDNLTSLEIDAGYFDVEWTLPTFLPNLKELTIAGHKAILQQPSLNNAAKWFLIDDISDDPNIVKLLNLINSALIRPEDIQDHNDH